MRGSCFFCVCVCVTVLLLLLPFNILPNEFLFFCGVVLVCRQRGRCGAGGCRARQRLRHAAPHARRQRARAERQRRARVAGSDPRVRCYRPFLSPLPDVGGHGEGRGRQARAPDSVGARALYRIWAGARAPRGARAAAAALLAAALADGSVARPRARARARGGGGLFGGLYAGRMGRSARRWIMGEAPKKAACSSCASTSTPCRTSIGRARRRAVRRRGPRLRRGRRGRADWGGSRATTRQPRTRQTGASCGCAAGSARAARARARGAAVRSRRARRPTHPALGGGGALPPLGRRREAARGGRAHAAAARRGRGRGKP